MPSIKFFVKYWTNDRCNNFSLSLRVLWIFCETRTPKYSTYRYLCGCMWAQKYCMFHVGNSIALLIMIRHRFSLKYNTARRHRCNMKTFNWETNIMHEWKNENKSASVRIFSYFSVEKWIKWNRRSDRFDVEMAVNMRLYPIGHLYHFRCHFDHVKKPQRIVCVTLAHAGIK